MSIKKFEFKKSFEDVEIAGEVYRIDMSDEKLQEYQDVFKSFYEEAKTMEGVELEALTDEQRKELFNKQKENMKIATEKILGDGTFDKLYELAGRSTVNYMDLLLFVSDVMNERTESLKSDARKKYIKKEK